MNVARTVGAACPWRNVCSGLPTDVFSRLLSSFFESIVLCGITLVGIGLILRAI
jgi:hypothetical protein